MNVSFLVVSFVFSFRSGTESINCNWVLRELYMSDVSGFDFQVIIRVSAHEMREYKQHLMLETEVIFSLQNLDHIFTLLLTSATFKPLFCSAVHVGGETTGGLSFSEDLKIILPFHSHFISWGPFFQVLNVELLVAFGLSLSNVLQSEAAISRVY